MKVMIDIPKEFETDLQDKFNEFFERVKCDIDSSLKSQEISMCGNYERETVEMFLSAFEKATVIPDDATNGDMIKDMFPNQTIGCAIPITDRNGAKFYRTTINGVTDFYEEWWNAPYKKEVEE